MLILRNLDCSSEIAAFSPQRIANPSGQPGSGMVPNEYVQRTRGHAESPDKCIDCCLRGYEPSTEAEPTSRVVIQDFGGFD